MTVEKITALTRYFGLSTDTKPTDATVQPGSEFFETDTGEGFVFSDGAWATKEPGSPRMLDVSASINNVPAAITIITTVTIPRGVTRMLVIVANTSADEALDGFEVRMRVRSPGAFVTLASSAGDYTSPHIPLINVSGDLTVLGANVSGWLILDVRGLAEVQFLASSAAATADISIDLSSD